MKLTDVLRAKNRLAEEQEPVREQVANNWNEQVMSLTVTDIEPSPFQPRVDFNQGALEELASSIAEHGIIHPIIVRKIANGFELVAGERRLRAVKLLGWATIPAIVKLLDDKIAAEMALIENLQRRDLHFLEEAEGYERLIAEFSLTQDDLAKRIGKSQSSIANRLRLLKLDQSIRDIISREMLSERHARALLKLGTLEQQKVVLNAILKDGLSVRQTEEFIKNLLSEGNNEPKPQAKPKIIFKDIRLFTNSLRKLTNSLEDSGLAVDYEEEDSDDFYRVTVLIQKPERREQ